MNMKKLLALVCAMVMALCCCAVAEEAAEDVVLATINGENIMASEVDYFVDYLTSYYGQQGYATDTEEFAAAARQTAMQNVIMTRVAAMKAEEYGLGQLDDAAIEAARAEAKTEWDELVETVAQQLYGKTAESTEEEAAAAVLNAVAYIESMGYTEEIWLEEAVDSAKNNAIVEEMVKGATVSDEDIEAYYNETVEAEMAQYGTDVAMYEMYQNYFGMAFHFTPEGYRGIRQILLEVDKELLDAYQSATALLEEAAEATEGTEASENTVTAETVEAAKQAILDAVKPTVDEIRAKYEAGTSFEELMDAYNTDPGMTREPTRTEGYNVHRDSVVWDPSFVAAAFSVDEVGALAEPAVGSYGVYLVQYTRDVPAGAMELTDEVRAEIAEGLKTEAENKLFTEKMEAWMAECEIVYTDAAAAYLPTESAAE